MHYLYQSNRLEHLAAMLGAVMAQQPASPLSSEQVLVHSPGMATWLRLNLAARHGIAANIECPLPSTFFWQLHRRLHPDLPEQSAWSKDNLLWHLLAELPELLKCDAGAPLAHYLRDDSPLRRFQLCRDIADLFDQYLVYRPAWLNDWEAGRVSEVPDNRRWQPVLWQRLAARIRALAPRDLHRGELMDARRLREHLNPAQLPPRVFLFGPTTQPAAQLEALGVLGECCDVHLFLLNPSAEYWGHVQSDRQLARHRVKALRAGQSWESLPGEVGNPLLASLGAQGRELLELLLGGLWPQAQEIDAFVPPREDTLLGQVQADIFNLHDGRQAPRAAALHTIQLHDCHSPMREVEVLHDRLLALFEQDSTLRPRDVVVMMPDVGSYAPLIEAVFGADREPAIPWAIADRSLADEAPLLRSVLQLLQPRVSRFTANEVMDLLDVPAIRTRFGFSIEELPLLRRWISEAGIRWGLDEDHRARLALPAFRENSWAAGLERILLGVALGEEEQLWQTRPSLPGLTLGQAELAGRLGEFLHRLQRFEATLSKPASAAVWQQRLNRLLDDCYAREADRDAELDQLRAALDTLARGAGQALGEAPLDVDMVHAWLRQTLSASAGGQRFLAGRVNFCTLMPMRSVPFRVVCLLGMQDDAYPRPEQPVGHDLMRLKPLPGDRSRRAEDRYLFLEAVLSARDHLCISWCGRDSQDNSERPPSVVLAELTDYLDQAFEPVTDEQGVTQPLSRHLTCQHPLQPFSVRYFNPPAKEGADTTLFSYAAHWAEVAAARKVPCLNPPLQLEAGQAERLLDVGLNDLTRFLRNPAEAFLSLRLGVSLGDTTRVLDDDEPFVAGGLEVWQLEQQVLDRVLAAEPLEPLVARWQGSGQLPPGEAGQALVAEHVEAAAEHARRVRRLWAKGELLSPMGFSHQAGAVTLSGHFHELTGCGQQISSASRLFANRDAPRGGDALRNLKKVPKVRHMLALWLTHLALNTLPLPEPARRSTAFFRDVRLQLPALPADTARELLGGVMQAYQQGLTAPLAFMPQTGWAALVWPDKPDTVLQHLLGNDRQPGEAADVAVARLFPEPPLTDFMRQGKRLLGPLRDVAEVQPYD
ncbi:exodeoxyribonuclease V subunit gamma [Isoalcanivorax indicus]|uniref:exodeoxyribonuclease V subunit gamma n=1 Tax=Isoalcanivorax indicus TaxID=2202653 RepID=UPI000DBA51FB|nr:exodeoxyribonuclease V subunit gamma [Isoalcanivorax indicus]